MSQSSITASISMIDANGNFGKSIPANEWTPEVIKNADSFSVFTTDLSDRGKAEARAFFNEMVQVFKWKTVHEMTGTSLIKESEFRATKPKTGEPITNADGTPQFKFAIQCSKANQPNSAVLMRALVKDLLASKG
jgi:hypothetical protein